MHKEEVTHVISANHHKLLFTASGEGVLKIWRKKAEGIDLVKGLKAHKAALTDAKLNANESRLATTSAADCLLKLYDVANFDLMQVLKLTFVPASLAFVTKATDFY